MGGKVVTKLSNILLSKIDNEINNTKEPQLSQLVGLSKTAAGGFEIVSES